MSLWALVPAKSFDLGKSRLKPALSDEARRDFARSLFDHVLLQLRDTVDGILVCTDSDEVARAATEKGAHVHVRRDREKGLAAIVDGGLAELSSQQALVIMADLPKLTQ